MTDEATALSVKGLSALLTDREDANCDDGMWLKVRDVETKRTYLVCVED